MSATTTPAATTTPSTTTTSNVTSYLERRLNFIFKIGKGSHGEGGYDNVKLEHLRGHVSILKNGLPSVGSATMEIYGMPPDLMNKLTTLGAPIPLERNNAIEIEAGDDTYGMFTVYTGTIQEAYQNLDGAPETFLQVNSNGLSFENVKPAEATSFRGASEVATVVASIALRMGRQFVNNGVTAFVSNPYYAGTLGDQLKQIKRETGIEMDDDGVKITIWPRNSSRKTAIPVISPASGLIGYPKWAAFGMVFRTLFNPSISFGGQIEMKSSITPANGIWNVRDGLSYDLSSEIAGGPWFMSVNAFRDADHPPPVASPR